MQAGAHFLFSERGVLLEQNRERTGIELPYEQAAMNKEPMPEGLEFPDQIMYQGLRYLYAYYKMGWISLPHCSIEKRYMLEEYRRNQFADACGKKHMQMIRETELARAAYRKNRTLENADALVRAIDGVP